MICLTGDLHHMTLKTGNQAHCDITEMQVAVKYLKLLEKHGVKVTYFVTGKSFAEEWEDLKYICNSKNVELGGHNYYAFKPELLHRIWNKLAKNYNGPYFYQKWDTNKTIKIIEKKTGIRVNVWRNHMYMHGPNTEKILAECGIKICSDGVKKDNYKLIADKAGIYNFPINIIPDHEHLIHAERTEEWISWWQKRYNWSDDFGPDSYYIDEWTDIVLAGLEENEKKGLVSNMIIHPITLYLCDKLESFEKRILPFLASHKTIFISEMLKEQN